MASRMVVFPAPVGPAMAKIPSEVKAGCVRSISHSPTSEFRFLNRTCNIFIGSLSIPLACRPHRETKVLPDKHEVILVAGLQALHARSGIARIRRSHRDRPVFLLHEFFQGRGR